MNIRPMAHKLIAMGGVLVFGELAAVGAPRNAAAIDADLQKLNTKLVMFDTFDISMIKPLPPDMRQQPGPPGAETYMVMVPSRQGPGQMYVTDSLLAALKQRVALLRELEAADPQDKDATESQVEAQLARLAVLQDRQTLDDLSQATASNDPAVAERARMTLALREWLAHKDVRRQRQVLDRVASDAKAQPTNDDIARTLLEMSRTGAAEPKLAQEALAIVSTELKGPYARALRSVPNRLNSPLVVTGTSVNGQTLSTSQWKGKVVMVDFWATWCPPCRAEMPRIVALYNKYHDQGLEILGVSNDSSKLDLIDFLKQHPEMKWPQLYGPSSSPSHWNRITERFHINAIPTVYLIDRNGILRLAEIGGGPRLEQNIQDLLAEQPEPVARAAPKPAEAAPKPEPADAAAALQAPATPKAADVDANAIEKADAALSLARAYVSAGRYDAARARLQSIIHDYPKTTSAKQAKELLDQIAGK